MIRALLTIVFVVSIFSGCSIKEKAYTNIGVHYSPDKVKCIKSNANYKILEEKYMLLDNKYVDTIINGDFKSKSVNTIVKSLDVVTELAEVSRDIMKYCEKSLFNSALGESTNDMKYDLLRELKKREVVTKYSHCIPNKKLARINIKNTINELKNGWANIGTEAYTSIALSCIKRAISTCSSSEKTGLEDDYKKVLKLDIFLRTGLEKKRVESSEMNYDEYLKLSEHDKASYMETSKNKDGTFIKDLNVKLQKNYIIELSEIRLKGYIDIK